MDRPKILLLPGRISRCKRPLYRGGWSCVEKLLKGLQSTRSSQQCGSVCCVQYARVNFRALAAGTPKPTPSDLAHLSPLGWEHINLTGDYHWETAPVFRSRSI